jgi:SNF2 family DNA or RNA helicase
MEIVNDAVVLVKTKQPHLITERIKKSKVLREQDGLFEVAIHWGLAEAQALAAIGLKTSPSPMLRDYVWTGKLSPFAHQKETSGFLTLRKKAFCFNEQGTGKTASVIWAVDYLMKINAIKRVLVICPLSIMKPSWQQDLFKFAMHRSCSVAHGDAAARRKILNAKSEFVIINFDGVAVIKDEIINGGFDMVVVDEASAYKNVKTNRWKVLNEIMSHVEWLWMLTGTPAAQSPLDAYGLAKLVNPAGAPKYFGQFRDMVMYKVTEFLWKPRNTADKIVHTMLQPAIRFEKDQCLDLPPLTFVERDAPLTPMQQTYYTKLKNQMTCEAAGEQITSVNAATNLNKLLQISGGCGLLGYWGGRRVRCKQQTERGA